MNKRPTPIKFSSLRSRGDTGLEFGGLRKSRERWTLKSSIADEFMSIVRSVLKMFSLQLSDTAEGNQDQNSKEFVMMPAGHELHQHTVVLIPNMSHESCFK